MKKIILCLGMLIGATFATQAQTGLEAIVVEKFYTSDADEAADVDEPVPNGSVTYRIYVDLAAGAKLTSVYGNTNHTLSFQTTTGFFNNMDRGAADPASISLGNSDNNTTFLDSWVTMGNTNSSGYIAVPKTLDPDGVDAGLTFTAGYFDASPNAIVGNADGMVLATSTDPLFLTPGMAALLNDAFNTNGSTGMATNGEAWLIGAGVTGATAENMVLIGQFTTDGAFSYEINLQLDNNGTTENWVSSNPTGAEATLAGLSGTYAPNTPPTVTLTAPVDGATAATGDVVALTATASDVAGLVPGTITQVEFFNGATSLGVDATAPYEGTFSSATEGTFAITAVATDNEDAKTTSSIANVTITNPAPIVAITSPADGTTYTIGDVATIEVTASDDGSVAQVEFFDGATSLGTDATAPYSMNITLSTTGTKIITAVATDEEGKSTTSATVSVIVPSTVSYAIFDESMECHEGNTFSIPVMRTNAIADVYGFDVEITYEKSMVAPTGYVSVNNDMINHLYVGTTTDIKESQGKMSISVYLNGLGGTNLFDVAAGDSAQVISIEFERLAGFNLEDSVLFSATVIESYSTYTVMSAVEPGYFKITGTSSVDGNLKYWSNDEAIGYNGSNLITDITTTGGTVMNPNANGEFFYDLSDGDAISVTRDIDNDTDVMSIINGFDALLTAKVAVDDPSFTPSIYQIIAMDVNLDGVVSAGDVSQIFRRTTGAISEFEQTTGAGTDWFFVDEAAVLNNAEYSISTTFPLPDGQGYAKSMVPTVNEFVSLQDGECANPEKTIVGIMLGDVNGSYKNLSPSHPHFNLLKSETLASETEAPKAVIFDFDNAIDNGIYVEMPVYINTDFAINSLDFAVEYNSSNLSFVDVVNPVEGLKLMVYDDLASSTLRFTSYKETELANNIAIITVRFEKAAKTTKSDILSTTAYLNGDLVNSGMKEDGDIVNGDKQVEAAIYPNPATVELNIIVSQKSNIRIVNDLGQVLFSHMNLEAEVILTVDVESYARGTYHVEVKNETSTTIESFVKK